MAEYAKRGDAEVAVTAIIIAALSNTAVKCGIALTIGAPALRPAVAIGAAVIVAAGIAAVVVG
jgi:uncharacterized membrane protein (DUF4010 family)